MKKCWVPLMTYGDNHVVLCLSLLIHYTDWFSYVKPASFLCYIPHSHGICSLYTLLDSVFVLCWGFSSLYKASCVFSIVWYLVLVSGNDSSHRRDRSVLGSVLPRVPQNHVKNKSHCLLHSISADTDTFFHQFCS